MPTWPGATTLTPSGLTGATVFPLSKAAAKNEAALSSIQSWLGQDGVFSPSAYGTVDPTDSSDNHTAIQGALDAAVAAGGGFVPLGAGTFKCNSKLTTYKNVTIQGAGRSATILKAGGAIVLLEAAEDDTGSDGRWLAVTDLTLDGDAGGAGGTTGLNLISQYRFGVERVFVTGFATQGIKLDGTLLGQFTDVLVESCPIGVKAIVNVGGAARPPNLVTFKNCMFNFNTNKAVDWDGGGSVNFLHCDFEQNGTDGTSRTIRMTNGGWYHGGPTLNVSDSWFEENCGVDVYLDDPAEDDAYASITNTTFIKTSGGTLTHHIVVVGTGTHNHHLTTINNVLSGAGTADVYLTGNKAHWHRGPGKEAVVATALGYVYDFGRTATYSPPLAFVSDTMTDTATTTFASHTGETGATWTKHPSYTAGALQISNANRLRTTTDSQWGLYYASGTPAGPGQVCSADFLVKSTTPTASVFGQVRVRCDMAADTCYTAVVQESTGGVTAVALYKYVAGTSTQLGTNYTGFTAVADTPFTLSISATGTSTTALVVSVNGSPVITQFDSSSPITAAGKAAVGLYAGSSDIGDSLGIHADNFTATDA